MLTRSARRLLGLSLLGSACALRPVATTDEPGTASSTSDATTSTGGEDPTTSTSPATTTADDTTTTSTSTGDATTGSPPAGCSAACDETWEFNGDLTIAGDAPPVFFDCLTRVRGSLTIEEDVPLDVIASLSDLAIVDSTLWMLGHQELADVAHLACLREVGGLSLRDLPQVTDLAPLAGLRAAAGIQFTGLGISALPTFAPDFTGIDTITLERNPNLVDIGAMATWGVGTAPITILIDRNPALTTLAGLEGPIAGSGGDVLLYVTAMDGLTSLAGLEPATSGYYSFYDLPGVTDLAPLAGLENVSALALTGMPKVASLAGLEGLVTADTLTIGNCSEDIVGGMDGLTSLAGLDALTTVDTLLIARNAGLTSLAGAPALKTAPFAVSVLGNPELTQQAHDAFLAQLDGPPFEECFGDPDVCPCFEIIPW